MSFDRFLLAVESRDLSQTDKSVFFFNFTKLQFLNDKIYSYKLCFETKSTNYLLKNVTIEKFRKQFCFFTCILPEYLFHES